MEALKYGNESLAVNEKLIQHYFNQLSIGDQEHCYRVEELSLKIAKELKDESINFEDLKLAARYHDVGKIKIPKRILEKPGALTHEERQHIMVHSKFSSQLLEQTGHGKDVVKFVMLHHENFDGSGYPFGLKGAQIPIEARIIRVADVFDALSSVRSYKSDFPTFECLKIMEESKLLYEEKFYTALLMVASKSS